MVVLKTPVNPQRGVVSEVVGVGSPPGGSGIRGCWSGIRGCSIVFRSPPGGSGFRGCRVVRKQGMYQDNVCDKE